LEKQFSYFYLFNLNIDNILLNVSKKNTPEYVSKQFLVNFQKLNFEEASKYGTENTKMMIAFFKNIIGMMPADKRDSLQIPKADVVIKKMLYLC